MSCYQLTKIKKKRSLILLVNCLHKLSSHSYWKKGQKSEWNWMIMPNWILKMRNDSLFPTSYSFSWQTFSSMLKPFYCLFRSTRHKPFKVSNQKFDWYLVQRTLNQTTPNSKAKRLDKRKWHHCNIYPRNGCRIKILIPRRWHYNILSVGYWKAWS